MESDYKYAGESACADVRPLENINAMADEVSVCADRLTSVLARFQGGGLDGAKAGPSPVPSGYLGQMDRLRGQIALVDKLTSELASIC